jgi:hypothetical protein
VSCIQGLHSSAQSGQWREIGVEWLGRSLQRWFLALIFRIFSCAYVRALNNVHWAGRCMCRCVMHLTSLLWLLPCVFVIKIYQESQCSAATGMLGEAGGTSRPPSTLHLLAATRRARRSHASQPWLPAFGGRCSSKTAPCSARLSCLPSPLPHLAWPQGKAPQPGPFGSALLLCIAVLCGDAVFPAARPAVRLW